MSFTVLKPKSKHRYGSGRKFWLLAVLDPQHCHKYYLTYFIHYSSPVPSFLVPLFRVLFVLFSCSSFCYLPSYSKFFLCLGPAYSPSWGTSDGLYVREGHILRRHGLQIRQLLLHQPHQQHRYSKLCGTYIVFCLKFANNIETFLCNWTAVLYA